MMQSVTEPLLSTPSGRGNRYAQLYHYWRYQGFTSILTNHCLNFASGLFAGTIAVVLGGAIDYKALYDQVHHPVDNTPLLGSVISLENLKHANPALWVFAFFYFAATFLYALHIVLSIPKLYRTKRFVNHKLGICDSLLGDFKWSEITSTVPNSDAMDVTRQITRINDLLIDMVIAGDLDPYITLPWGAKQYMWPSVLHMMLVWAIRPYNINQHRLRFRLVMAAAISVVIAPIVFFLRLANVLFRSPDQWRTHTTLRQWSPWSRLLLRNYYEVDHLLDERLERATRPAFHLMDVYIRSVYDVFVRFGLFVFGGLALVLAVLAAVYDEGFLTLELTPGRSVAFWLAMFTTVAAMFSGLLPPRKITVDIDTIVSELTQNLSATILEEDDGTGIRNRIARLFVFRLEILLHEILGIVWAPYILLGLNPKDLMNHITKRDRSATTTSLEVVGQSFKLNESIVQFRNTHPLWNPISTN